jgi:polysaccharide chain length determinant protein (PEP-CTERM system associated)
MHELAYQLLSYAKAAWHYRWFAVLIAWLVALAGWAAVHRMPDRYEASARVWVDTQSVVKHLLADLTAQPNVTQMVTMISRTLISRPNLDRVITMANIEIDPEAPNGREQMITRLSKELTVLSAGAENFYVISYTANDPQKAKRVVQSLLTIFEEGSLGDQRRDAETAQRFIDEELKNYKAKLEAAENDMIDFRRRQMRVLASTRADLSGQLVAVEASLREAELELKIAEAGRDAIKMNFQDAIETPSLLAETSAELEAEPLPEYDPRLKALEEKLESLRMNYTEQHPDVIAMRRTIDQLKGQKKPESKPVKAPAAALEVRDNASQQLTLSLAAAEANVTAAKARVDEYRKRHDDLLVAAIAAPQIDARYTQVVREYDTAKSNYAALLARRETARISSEMEARTRATNFRVIDPPLVPFLPKAPNRQLLNSMALLMGLGAGMAFAFLLSQIRPTFNDERRLKEVSGLPVLGTVVAVLSGAQKARRTGGFIALVFSFAGLVSAYAVIVTGLALTFVQSLK